MKSIVIILLSINFCYSQASEDTKIKFDMDRWLDRLQTMGSDRIEKAIKLMLPIEFVDGYLEFNVLKYNEISKTLSLGLTIYGTRKKDEIAKEISIDDITPETFRTIRIIIFEHIYLVNIFINGQSKYPTAKEIKEISLICSKKVVKGHTTKWKTFKFMCKSDTNKDQRGGFFIEDIDKPIAIDSLCLPE